MDLRYKALLLTVKFGSLTLAGEVLGYTESGISHIIRNLERSLGLQLLYRSRGGVQLSANGQRLLPYFETICNSQEQLKRNARILQSGEGGLLRIASHSSICSQLLPYVFKEFQSTRKNVQFDLHEVFTSKAVKELLDRKAVDIGFLKTPSDRIDDTVIYQDPIVAVLPSNHELSRADFFPMQALDKYPYISLDETPGVSNAFTTLVDEIFASCGKAPRTIFSVRYEHTALAMISNGFGFSIIPEMAIDIESYNFPVVILPLEKPYFWNLYIVTNDKDKKNILLQDFIQLVQYRMKERSNLNIKQKAL